MVPGLLPQATIFVNGQPSQVQDLTRAMLVLIPAHCKCSATVSWLITVAAGAHAHTFLIYTTSTAADVERMSQRLSSGIRVQASLALEPGNVLRSSIPGNPHQDDLAAILVGVTEDPVNYATGLSPRDNPTTLIHALTH